MVPGATGAGMGHMDNVWPPGLDIRNAREADRGGARVPSDESAREVNERLNALYGRVSAAGDEDVKHYYESGRGYYTRQLAGHERDQFGISLAGLDGDLYHAGDHERAFPLHSISKVFAYALALEDCGRDTVMRHVGVEPSGDAFNSITFDEHAQRPFNPMVNAGALATSALLRGNSSEEQSQRALDLVRRLAGNDQLTIDEDVFAREMNAADRNRATAYLMRSDGMLSGDVEEILAVYLRQCAITVTTADLAVIAATLANGAVNPRTAERVLSQRVNRDVLSVMYTCGMYDFAGEWAYQVGVPAKSGVSGGIIAVIPGKMGVGTFSPGLDRFGNSVRGVMVCHELSERLGLHVFASEAEDTMLAAGAATPPELDTDSSN
jgi:glutaminase